MIKRLTVRRTREIGTCLAVLVLASTASAFEVKKTKGTVHVERAGELVEASKKMSLMAGDVIVTKRRSRALIKSQSQQIWIGQNTRFRIEETEGEEAAGAISLLYGKFRAKVEKKQKRDFRYKLQTAVAGVRGTEFFAESQESGDTLCTLDGEVGVELESGEVIAVPRGKGLRLNPGGVPRLSDNSPFLVQQWVAQTDFEGGSVGDAYAFEPRRHPVSDLLSVGAFGWAYYCDATNPDFDNSISDANDSCLRSYISPFLRYGKTHSVFLRPMINHFWRNKDSKVDPVPLEVAKNKKAVGIAEAYYAYGNSNLELRLGQQEIAWGRGALLSTRYWSPEPTTHLGVTASYLFPSGYQLEAIATKGDSNPAVLDGHSPVSLAGLVLALPGHWGEFFFLNSKFENTDPQTPFLFRGRDSTQAGIYSKQRIGRLDYEASFISQQHKELLRDNGDNSKADASYIDVEAGYSFQLGFPTRLSIRNLLASANFVGVHEDWYQLGASGIFSKRINIQQTRIKYALQTAEDRQFFLEWISSTQPSSEGLKVYAANLENGAKIGNEINLLYSEKAVLDRANNSWSLSWHLGLWQFQPEQLGSDPSQGLIARLEFIY